jgi:hypothetical protein
MSQTIDERVVSMKFDNDQFEKNVSTSMGTIDKLKKSLDFKGAETGLTNVSKAAGSFNLSGMSTAIDSINEKFSAMGIAGMTVINRLTNDAITAAKNLAKMVFVEPIQTGKQMYETMTQATKTIMAGTGEKIGVVTKALKDLNDYSNKTIYSFQDMTSNVGKFTNAGVKLNDAVAAIKGIDNEAALSGATAAESARTMYNLAQSLSMGYTQLIDWKSVENANMATVEFKKNLTDTAVKMGVITKTSNGMFKTGKKTYNLQQMFKDGLKEQWLTSKVLISTLKEYADETTDIGKRAYKAAAQVNTFSQLIDVIKDELGTSWSQTFNIVVGNLNQATKLFTDWENVFGSLINASSNARNGLLADWAKLKGRSDVIQTLINLFNALATVVGPIKEAFQDIFPPITAQTLKNITQAVEDFTKKLILNRDQQGMIKTVFEAVFSIIKGGLIIVKGLAKVFVELLKALSPVGEILLRIIQIVAALILKFNNWVQSSGLIQSAFQFISDAIAYAGEKLKDFLKTLSQNKVVITIAELFLGVIEKIKEALLKFKFPAFSDFLNDVKKLKSVGAVFGGFFDKIKGIKNILPKSTDFSKLTASIAAGSTRLVDFNKILNSGYGDKFQSVIKDVARSHGIAIDDMIKKQGSLKAVFKSGGISADIFKEAIAKMSSTMAKKVDFSSGPLGIVTKFVSSIGTYKTSIGTVSDVIGGFRDKVKDAFGNIKDTIVTTFEKIKAVCEKIDWDKVIGVAKFIASIAILWELKKTIDALISTFAGIGNVLNSTAGVLKGTSDVLHSYAKTLKAKALKDVAISIAILAGSLIALSFVDSNSLIKAGVALGALAAGIVAIDFVLSKINSSPTSNGKGVFGALSGALDAFKNFGKAAEIIAVAAAALLFVVALQKMAGVLSLFDSLPIKDMGGMLKKLGIAFGILIGAIAVIGLTTKSAGPGVAASALTMLTFVRVLQKMADVMTQYDQLKINDMEGMAKKLGVAFGILIGMIIAVGLSTKGAGPGVAASALTMLTFVRVLQKMADVMTQYDQLDISDIKGTLAKLAIAAGTIAGVIVAIGLTTKKNLGGMIGSVAVMLTLVFALKQMESVMQDYAKLSWTDIGKGSVVIGVVAGSMALVAAVAGKCGKTGPLLAMAATILALTAALSILAVLPFDGLMQGAVALGGVMLAIGGALKLASNSQKALPAMIVMTAAIFLIAPALEELAKLPFKNLITAAASLAGIMLAIGGALRLMGDDSLKHAVAFGIVSAGLLLISASLLQIGALPLDQLIAAGAVLSGVSIAIAGALKLMGSAIKNAVAFDIAALGIMAIAVSLLAISTIPMDQMIASAGSLALSLLALGIAVNSMTGSLAGAGALAIASVGLIALAYALTMLGSLSLPQMGIALLGLAGGLAAICIAAAVMIPLAPGVAILVIALAAIAAVALSFAAAAASFALAAQGFAAALQSIALYGSLAAMQIVMSMQIITAGILSLLQYLAANAYQFAAAAMAICTNFINGLAQGLPGLIQAGFNDKRVQFPAACGVRNIYEEGGTI